MRYFWVFSPPHRGRDLIGIYGFSVIDLGTAEMYGHAISVSCVYSLSAYVCDLMSGPDVGL